MENKFYVYVHTRATDGSIFYVGKGEGKRAWNVSRRNKHWKNIATKHGYNVTILLNNLTEEQAFILEKQAIATLGRESLCNMTDGGEGSSGRIPSEETRKKLSESGKGRKHTLKAKRKMSESGKGRKMSDESKRKNSEAKKGSKRSEETKSKISEAKKGRPAHNKGKKWSPESIAKRQATRARNRLLSNQH